MGERIDLAHAPPFALGALAVSPATRTVARGGAETVVEPRVMQVLVALAEANGAVVSRDDLIERCWEGRIVGDDAINRVLSRLRALAHETGEDSFRIETITRVGYRLVRLDGRTAVPKPHDQVPAVDRRIVLAAGIGGAAAVAAGTAFWLTRPAPDPLPPAAREAITRGYAALRDTVPDRTAEAVAAFRQATELAPDAAEPWGKLALAYHQQFYFSGAKDPAYLQQLEARGHEAIARALAIDPGNADALTARATLRQCFGNWLAFDRACRLVLARYPDHVPLNRMYSALLANVGRFAEASVHLRHAIALDPAWPQSYSWLTLQLLATRHLDEADAVIGKAFATWPRHYSVWFTRVRLLAYTGRGEAALAMLADTANRPIGIPDWNFAMTAAETRAVASRAPADVDAASRMMFDAAHRAAGLAENAVVFHAVAGRIDQAFALLDAYYFDRGFSVGPSFYSEEQGQYMPRRERFTWYLLGTDAAPLRRDSRFAPLIATIGLENYWRRSGIKPDYRT